LSLPMRERGLKPHMVLDNSKAVDAIRIKHNLTKCIV